MLFPGAVPLSQINALPLLSTDQLAFGGSVSVLGGAINRYFTPAQTGIDGALMNVADPDPSGVGGLNPYIVISNVLDVRGCSAFTLALAVKVANHDQEWDGATYCPIFMDWRVASTVAADVPSVAPRTGFYGSYAWPMAGSVSIQGSGAAAGPFDLYKTATRSWRIGGSPGGSTYAGALGFIQLWCNLDNSAPTDPGALLYVSLYATS